LLDFLFSIPQALIEIKMDAACCGQTGLARLATCRPALLLFLPKFSSHIVWSEVSPIDIESSFQEILLQYQYGFVL